MLTEKEKSLRGYMYNPNEESLVHDRKIAKDLYFEYNHTLPSNIEKRTEIITKLIGAFKGNFLIEQPFYCTYGYNISLGANFFANIGCTISDGAHITFGDNVCIAPHVSFLTEGHAFTPELRKDGWEYAYPITVGSNVWICANVSILPGVTIGDNSIIGAGSVVTKDIPAGVLAYGNPCRVIRSISEEDKNKFTWFEQ